MKCPVCRNKMSYLKQLSGREDNCKECRGVKCFFCWECNTDFYMYPKRSGAQRSGLYVHIPVRKFSREVWQDLLLIERNIYGEEIPEWLGVSYHPCS